MNANKLTNMSSFFFFFMLSITLYCPGKYREAAILTQTLSKIRKKNNNKIILIMYQDSINKCKILRIHSVSIMFFFIKITI